MKARYITVLSVGTLVLLLAFQMVGVWYSYQSLMRKSAATLSSCFKATFSQVVDAPLNHLPYPDYTITHLTYVPYISHMNAEDKYLYISQQTSAVLQDYYHLPETSIDTLRLALSDALRREGIEGSVYIRKWDAHSGHQLATSPAAVDLPARNAIGVLVSPSACLHEPRGITVEAVVDLHYWRNVKHLLFLAGIFFTSVALLLAFVVRIRLLLRLEQSIDRQRTDFFRQAEDMAVPLHGLEADLHAARWQAAGNAGQLLFQETEATLTRAKEENKRLTRANARPLRFLSWGVLALSILLPCLWAWYIYHEQWQAGNREAQVCFEHSFNAEANLRYLDYLRINKLDRYDRYVGITRQAQQQAESLESTFYYIDRDKQGHKSFRVRLHAELLPHYVLRQGMDLSQGIRLYRAYNTQGQINKGHLEEGHLFMPLDTLRLDSLFRAELQQAGMDAGSGLRVLRTHGQEEVKRVGDSAPLNSGSFLTTPLRLTEDGSVAVQGLVPAPQRYVVRSAWYLFLPLGLLLLFSLFCVGGLWYVWRRLRRLEQFRKDFTYAMIHDMKSPLQSILMGTQILSSGKLAEKPERAARILSGMLDECAHLFTLSNRVITLTQIDRGTLELHSEHLALRPLLDDLTAKFSLKSTKPLTFQVDCSEDFTVYADAFCLREVLSNLIDNAIKYSGDQVTIRLTASSTPAATLLRITDNGLGIAPRDLPLIFRKYERAAAAARSSRGGASGFGLGLSFVRQVVEAHGGHVTVSSTVGAGTEFTVSLPNS